MSLSLETRFDTVIEQLDTHILSTARVYPLLDLTRLDETAVAEDIKALGVKAQQDRVAAICVFPQHLAWVPPLNAIQRATVVNFPGGHDAHEQILRDIEQAIADQHADEIDYVFAYPTYLAGQQSHALAWCREAYELCRQHGRLFKVILETGALQSLDMIYQLSCDVIENGCDMLKTSTGKINIGASLPAAFAILTAIQDSQISCGIKISGGIKTLAQASHYIHLAEHMLDQSVTKNWFRIGASQIHG
jgi:deoxyribose-phosphate aldolase